jgi:hypothetical protein
MDISELTENQKSLLKQVQILPIIQAQKCINLLCSTVCEETFTQHSHTDEAVI